MLNSHKSIIFLNGIIPEADFIKIDVPLLCADGAAKRIKFSFDYILGDMDSYQKQDEKIIKNFDQNFTDFEKALFFVKKKKLFPSLVLGINGGEIDHIIGNIQIMLKYIEIPSYFLDSYDNGWKIGIPIKGKKVLKTKKNSLISIITMEKTILSTKGLKWELRKDLLDPNGMMSLRNETMLDTIEINVLKGKVLIILDF